jgi:hypothetical protein
MPIDGLRGRFPALGDPPVRAALRDELEDLDLPGAQAIEHGLVGLRVDRPGGDLRVHAHRARADVPQPLAQRVRTRHPVLDQTGWSHSPTASSSTSRTMPPPSDAWAMTRTPIFLQEKHQALAERAIVIRDRYTHGILALRTVVVRRLPARCLRARPLVQRRSSGTVEHPGAVTQGCTGSVIPGRTSTDLPARSVLLQPKTTAKA